LIDKNRESIQKSAVESCLQNVDSDSSFKGTCEVATGTGKTFIAFWMIYHLKPSTVLFLAETQLRERNISDDMLFFKKCYNIDIASMCNIEFACYQSAYKWENRTFDMVVADEIHDSLSPEYFKFYQNNTYKHLLGLSATIDSKTKFGTGDTEYTKVDLLNRIAPIVFKYTLKQGIENNTSRKLHIIVIKHALDRVGKNMPVTYKDKQTGQDKTFFQTEQEMYDYYNQKFYHAIYQKEKNDFLIRLFTTRRNAVLYKAKSKMEIVKKLLAHLNRTIVFGNDIDSIGALIPTVSSRNKPATNSQIITDFNEGRIGVIGSFKMLKQGVNLKNLDNVIMHSYYGVEKDAIQRAGRLRQSHRDGFIFVILTMGTQEQVWFNRMIEPLNTNLIWCENTAEAINVWKNLNR